MPLHERRWLKTIETRIPARLDRLPWTNWHWLVLIGLGTVWILDGLEVTIVGSIASRLTEKGSGITITESQIGTAAAVYVAGACVGRAVLRMAGRPHGPQEAVPDHARRSTSWPRWPRRSRRRSCSSRSSASSPAPGIGGEYAAINSAIDELIPARVRGTVDLIINGSFWVGTAVGAAAVARAARREALRRRRRLAPGLRARRRARPSASCSCAATCPRARAGCSSTVTSEDAEALVDEIEHEVEESTGAELEPSAPDASRCASKSTIGFITIARTVFGAYPRRTIVGLSLFIGQAFLYNAVFFTYALVLTTFYGVSSGSVPLYIIPFAVGNFLGPLVLGRLFDSVGRKPMIAGTYIVSGLLLVVTAFLFKQRACGRRRRRPRRGA